MSTIKVTNITPQSGTTVNLTGSLTISETLTAKEVRTSINSSEILVSGSTKFGDTADDTHQFTGSLLVNGNTTQTGTIDVTGATSKVRFLYATTGDLPAAADYHGMFAHVHAEGAAYYAHAGNWVKLANSSSFATDIATNVTNISSNDADITALQTDSGSFSTRITTEEGNVDALQTDVTALQTDSGSFGTRITAEEANVDALQVDSGSFSTRVTTNETNITALETFSSSLDSTYATDAQLNSVSASVKTFATDADTTLSSSLATDIATINAATSSYQPKLTSASPIQATYIIPAFFSGSAGISNLLTGSSYDNASMVKLDYTGSANGTATCLLPDATLNQHKYRSIRLFTSSSVDNQKIFKVQPSGSQLLDGSNAGQDLDRSYEGIMVWSDGIEWYKIQSKNV